jgi:alginate O-acetyltransferase complex protein AlgI
MAVGLGRMMGFEFIKNFNAPYRSVSMSDFWNRWHISLSTWIRDYLYISLGGNRRGPVRTYFNLGVSMFLCGLWHGAQMTFVIWGIFHGALLIWERTMGRQPIYRGLPVVLKIIITNIIIMFGWVVFRTPSMDQAFMYWGAMLGFGGNSPAAAILHAEVFSAKYVFEMVIIAICTWQPIQAHNWVDKLTPLKITLLIVLFIYAVAAMFTQAFNPFLYFQF